MANEDRPKETERKNKTYRREIETRAVFERERERGKKREIERWRERGERDEERERE